MELKKILIAAVLVAGMAFQTNAADIPRKNIPVLSLNGRHG